MLMDENVIERLRVAVNHIGVTRRRRDALGRDVNEIRVDQIRACQHDLVGERPCVLSGLLYTRLWVKVAVLIVK
jgi:hypothetical protein